MLMALVKQTKKVTKIKVHWPESILTSTQKIVHLKEIFGVPVVDLSTLFGRKRSADRSREVFSLARDPETYEVTVRSAISLGDYEMITPPADWQLLLKMAAPMRGKRVAFINPTMEGGGVAMLRPPLVHMLNQLGVEAHWYVMAGLKDPGRGNPFLFTKRMHNILQRRAQPGERITADGKQLHQAWNAENAEVLLSQETIQSADVVVIDDPQPAPLIGRLKASYPEVKIVWRNHIDTSGKLMSDPSTPQGEVMEYLLKECGAALADAVVAHPVESFVYPKMSDKTFFAPATVESFDDLNRELTKQEVADGVKFINGEIKAKNAKVMKEDRLSAIDPARRRIALVARFDESKGMDKAMELGVQTRRMMIEAGYSGKDLPQIIIVGNGSVDDPSGEYMYEKMLQLRREKYADEKRDIILMRLRHNYKAMNALMYPAQGYDDLHVPALVAMQTSEAEGCETRISDWIRHGVPVVVSNRGGMSLQIIEDKSGLVLDFDKKDFDIERGAKWIFGLMTNAEAYADIRRSTLKAAAEFNNREFGTTANVTRLLRVFARTLDGKKADRTWLVSDLLKDNR